MSNFHPLEVVGRGSEAQLQVGQNLNNLIRRLKGYYQEVKRTVQTDDVNTSAIY